MYIYRVRFHSGRGGRSSSGLYITKISKVQAIQTFSKNFFLRFFTSSDRAWAADHEKLLFSLSKYFLLFEKYEIPERCRFSRKKHPLEMCEIFYFILSFCF